MSMKVSWKPSLQLSRISWFSRNDLPLRYWPIAATTATGVRAAAMASVHRDHRVLAQYNRIGGSELQRAASRTAGSDP